MTEEKEDVLIPRVAWETNGQEIALFSLDASYSPPNVLRVDPILDTRWRG
jgi:hypothetical protein